MEARSKVHEFYNENLKNVNWLDLPLPIAEVKNGKRDELAKYLRDRGIYTTYRYFPLHRVPGYGVHVFCPNADMRSTTLFACRCIKASRSMT